MEVINNDTEYQSVRNLEYAKQELLFILKIIVEIFEKNKIDYWIDAGTLLGAYRNNGFIPWDDDIDVSINKKHYIYACHLLKRYTKTHKNFYLLYEPLSFKHNCNYFGCRSRYLPLMPNNYYNLIKIDIRPINFIVNNEKQKKMAERLRNISNIILYNKVVNKDQIIINKIFKNKYIRCLLGPIFILIYNLSYTKNRNISNSIGFHPYYEYSNNKFINYDTIYPLKKIKFEDIIVNSPNKIMRYLSDLYNNFEKLPDKSKRCPDAIQYDDIENGLPKITKINPTFRKYYIKLYGKTI